MGKWVGYLSGIRSCMIATCLFAIFLIERGDWSMLKKGFMKMVDDLLLDGNVSEKINLSEKLSRSICRYRPTPRTLLCRSFIVGSYTYIWGLIILLYHDYLLLRFFNKGKILIKARTMKDSSLISSTRQTRPMRTWAIMTITGMIFIMILCP